MGVSECKSIMTKLTSDLLLKMVEKNLFSLELELIRFGLWFGYGSAIFVYGYGSVRPNPKKGGSVVH